MSPARSPTGHPAGSAPSARPRGGAWRYGPATTGTDLEGLVADLDGNLYTAECRRAGTFQSQCDLLSLSPSGTERWRTGFGHLSATGYGALEDKLLVAAEVVVSGIGRSWLDAFERTTGARRWSIDLSAPGVLPGRPATYVRFTSLGFDGADSLVVATESYANGATLSSALVRISVRTGAVTQLIPLPAQGFSVVLDRQANLFLAHSAGGPTWDDALSAFDARWNLQWQRLDPVLGSRVRVLQATHGGQLLVQHPDLTEGRSTSTGATTGLAVPRSRFGYGVVWSDRGLFTMQQHCPIASCSSFSDFQVDLVVVAGQARRAVLPRLTRWGGLWLTRSDTALFSIAPWSSRNPELWEVDTNANVQMRCHLEWLGGGRQLLAGPVLTQGAWAVVTGVNSEGYDPKVEVWSTPGYAPALTGWVSPRGGPTLDLRAR